MTVDTVQLTRPQLEALDALADGPCRRSNVTDADGDTTSEAEPWLDAG